MNNTDYKYELIDGIKCYAPELSKLNSDYPKEAFSILYEYEPKNFWFVSRNKVIQFLFGKFLGNKKMKVLEIGCGTGFVLKGLSEKFEQYDLYGSEIHLEGIKFAKKRLPHVEFIQLDATHMPFINKYDSICAFDVIEHIDEDIKVIQQVNKALIQGGYFFITVPQYQWMWSINDDLAYHKRRYSKSELNNKLENNNFQVEYLGSFVFTLFPFMVISRFLKRKKAADITGDINELKLNPFINTIFLFLMKMDEILISSGFKLPFGGSLIVVAKKK
ncbi:MAG: class I SAM-dependent methyltransferase [Chitinophagaceae bacterium]|nr:class I SAM-dependent methyltransferase [Chitinophagaceae bacterium]